MAQESTSGVSDEFDTDISIAAMLPESDNHELFHSLSDHSPPEYISSDYISDGDTSDEEATNDNQTHQDQRQEEQSNADQQEEKVADTNADSRSAQFEVTWTDFTKPLVCKLVLKQILKVNI